MSAKLERASNIASKSVELAGAKETSMKILISKADGANNFAMRMFEIAPQGHTPLHSHPHEHEVFVLEGEGVFICDGRENPIAQEHVIFVPGNCQHQFRNTGESTLRFLCLVPSTAS